VVRFRKNIPFITYFKPTDTPEKVLKDILQGLQLLKRQRDKGAR
jgi:hypothetical protein